MKTFPLFLHDFPPFCSRLTPSPKKYFLPSTSQPLKSVSPVSGASVVVVVAAGVVTLVPSSTRAGTATKWNTDKSAVKKHCGNISRRVKFAIQR